MNERTDTTLLFPSLPEMRKLLASKHHCSPELHRLGQTFLTEAEMAERALAQAATCLATIRPLDVMDAGEDLSVGECAERWRERVLAMVEGGV